MEMSPKRVGLRPVSREDVERVRVWLADEKISSSWFGRYAYGDPAHLGYHPETIDQVSKKVWGEVFGNSEHRILSVYTSDGVHIGESHLAVEESLGDGQLSILIGEKKMWHKGYGTAAVIETLALAFNEWGLYRVWADVPEYNQPALNIFKHIGFVHEGTLRKSRPHEGARFDSVVMGLLSTEYGRTDQEVTDSTISDSY